MSARIFRAHNWPTHARKTEDHAQKNVTENRNTSLCGLSSGLQCSLSPLRQNAHVCCFTKPFLELTVYSAIRVESNLEKSCRRNMILI